MWVLPTIDRDLTTKQSMFHQQGDIAYIRDISWDAKNVPPTYGNLNRKRVMGSRMV